MHTIESVVIGAGVIGLACARQMAISGQEVIILESQHTIGTETSSRNSEVIHAGIYYPKDSLKAKLCVQGKEMLYLYCRDRSLPHKRIGKLLVAVMESEIPELKKIEEKAKSNHVHDLVFLSATEIHHLEPKVKAVAGLFSPSTGIIDSHAFMLSLLGDAESRGAMLAVKSTVVGGEITKQGIVLQVRTAEAEEEILAKKVVNSAGLFAPEIALNLKGLPNNKIPKSYYCKGSYFTLNIPSPFKHLIYPMPDSAGLGVHVTHDLAGRARFGPDTEWVDNINYDIDIKRADFFYEAIRRYWPEIPDQALQPDYVGIRPKIVGKGEPAADFMIQTSLDHGIPGLVNLFGIESPGITAAFAIAEKVNHSL